MRQKWQGCVVIARRGEQPNLAESSRRRFAPFGGVDLELPPREIGRRAAYVLTRNRPLTPMSSGSGTISLCPALSARVFL
jgi:hypothetical protein